MKSIKAKWVALALGLCAAAGLSSAGVQADGGYNGIEHVWMIGNIARSKFLNNKEDINKDKEDNNKSKEDNNKSKEDVKEGAKEEIPDEDGGDKTLIDLHDYIKEDEGIKLDKGSFKDLCQGLDERLKKVEAQLAHLTDVIKQLANKGVPNKQPSEENQDQLVKSFVGEEKEQKEQKESEKSGVGNTPTQSQNQSIDNQKKDSEKSVVKEENNNQQENPVGGGQPQNNQDPNNQNDQNVQNIPNDQNVQPPVVNLDDQQFVAGMRNNVKNARQVLANVDDLLKDDIDV